MTSPILVTGGTGTLGRLVVKHLRAAGCDVRVLSRHSRESEPGIQFITGDLLTGAGVDESVQGVEAIVHCAGNFKGDAAMTRTLVQAASKAGSPHVVFISVVGTDRIPVVGIGNLTFAYFRAKREAEDVIASSGLPWTTLRATQFYDLFLIVGKAVAKLPVAPFAAGFRFQPVEADEVAARLVALAQGAPAGMVPDLGGPCIYRMSDLVRSYLRAVHRHRLLLPLWIPGKSARVVRAGGNLVAPATPAVPTGIGTWELFLAARTGAPTPSAPSSRRAATR
jgi:uncharacterized protein YbjT (DUF2867 family)